MKFGSFDGTPEEITDFFEQHGFVLAEYLVKPAESTKPRWVVIPAVIFFLSVPVLIYFNSRSNAIRTLFFCIDASVLVWLTVAIQVKFKNITATMIAAIGGLLILLVAAGVLPPLATLDAIIKFKPKE